MADMNRFKDYPELGITEEFIKGKLRYRHRARPDAIGVWISKEKIDTINDHISHDTWVDSAVCEAVVEVIKMFNLGDSALKVAQWNHYNSLLEGHSNWVANFEAEEARRLAIKYGLGEAAVRKAGLAEYKVLMEGRSNWIPSYEAKKAIQIAEEYNLGTLTINESKNRLKECTRQTA